MINRDSGHFNNSLNKVLGSFNCIFCPLKEREHEKQMREEERVRELLAIMARTMISWQFFGFM